MKSFPRVSLDRLITLERRPAVIQPQEQYAEIGIYSFGRGIFHKTPRTGFEVGNKKLFQIREGDFIFQITFAWEGAVGLASAAEDGMYGSVRFPTFRVDEEQCSALYLLYYFRTEEGRRQLSDISPGSAGRNRVLSLKRIPEVKIPLPPLPEQRRIVARIEELTAKIEEARGLRRQAVEEGEVLMISTISNLVDESFLKGGRLSDILVERPRNGWSAKCDNAEWGTPVLSLSAVTGFRYQENEYKRTSMPTKPDAHYWLKEGDLLITRSNTPELVGHAAIYNGSPQPCIYPDLIMRLKVNKDKADTRFVHAWLRSTKVREYIISNAKGSSPTMKKINQGTVMKIPFPTQLPIVKQRHIVAYLDNLQTKVDQLKQLQAETEAELEALLPSVLDKAFKGEL